MTKPKPGDLRIWWVPQVPMKAFRVNVPDIKTAKLMLDAFAQYDLFQLAHKVKPDFCNAGGLECFSQDGDNEWCEWYDEETGDTIDEHELEGVTP
jgi:hypothetical protein